ncbi:hypothetical protein Sjap_023509 [Stephania japonica]|uniref:Cytochrome P450 n=1 Tax=Stephania japonica TaxID=461633 RepID=A0AAP0EGE9_9MAGN
MAGFLVVIWGIFAFTTLLMNWNAMKYRQKGLPPGTMGWPVIGETLEFLKQGPNFMRSQRARYGNFFKTHILGSPTIISLDPEVNRYILLNEGKGLLPGYPQSLIDMLGKYNIASAHGSDHRFVRGTLISLIGSTIIKDRLLLKCDEFMHSYISNWDGKTIDIQDRTKDMILMLMLKMIANVESGPIPEAFKIQFFTLIDGTISLPLYIPGTHYYNGLKARENIISIIRRMIKERRASPSSQPDMLDSLLKIEDSNHKEISDENIIDQVITIIHSGYETVSTTTMMIVKYLHDHPKALQELRDTLFQKVGEYIFTQRNSTMIQSYIQSPYHLILGDGLRGFVTIASISRPVNWLSHTEHERKVECNEKCKHSLGIHSIFKYIWKREGEGDNYRLSFSDELLSHSSELSSSTISTITKPPPPPPPTTPTTYNIQQQ